MLPVLEKNRRINPKKVNGRKWADLNETESEHTIQRLKNVKSWFLKGVIKPDKCQARLMKKS